MKPASCLSVARMIFKALAVSAISKQGLEKVLRFAHFSLFYQGHNI